MNRQTIQEICFKNGYNRGVRECLDAQRMASIILAVLVCVCVILTAATAVSLSRFKEETEATMSELTAQVETITAEFRSIASRVEKLENQ